MCPIGGFLMVTSLIFESVWLIVVALLGLGHVNISIGFTSLYLSATMLQVCLLLIFVRFVSPMLMSYKIDPDNFMTPTLTALGDLVGTFLLWFVFIMSEDKMTETSGSMGVNNGTSGVPSVQEKRVFVYLPKTNNYTLTLRLFPAFFYLFLIDVINN